MTADQQHAPSSIVGGICHACGKERSLKSVGPDPANPLLNRLLCHHCQPAPSTGATAGGSVDPEAVYVITTDPGPHVEFIEMETADERSVSVPMERCEGHANRWRIGPLYRANHAGATAGGDRLEEIKQGTVDIGCTANWGETNWLLTEVAQLRSDLAHAQAERDNVDRVLKTLQRDRELCLNNHAPTAALMEAREESNHLRAQLAARDSHLATLQAVVEAVTTYRTAAAEAGNPMWPWPALEIALDQAQQQQQQEVPD